MSFLEPARLWLLLGVAALAAGYLVVAVRRRRQVVRFTNVDLLASVAPRRPGWRRHVPAVAQVAALAALVLALAQPTREELVPRERATVVLAVDVSGSMAATDVRPSRLDAAKAAALRFLEAVPDGVNVGLVTFNERAATRVEPTTDRDQVRRAVERMGAEGGTAIGEAILAGLEALSSVPPDEEGTPPPASIVLMSDGQTDAGRPNDAATRAAGEAGVPVSTVALGTDEGVVANPNGFGSIPVPVDGPALEAIAEATGGTFHEAGSLDQLSSVYEDLGSSTGWVAEQREVALWFVATSLVLLAAVGASSLAWSNRLP